MSFIVYYFVVVFLQLLIIAILLILLFRKDTQNSREFSLKLTGFKQQIEKTESLLREELARNRAEFQNNARHLREETHNSIKSFQDSLQARMNEILQNQKREMTLFSERLDKTGKIVEERLEKMRDRIEMQIQSLQSENSKKLDEMRNVVDEKLQTALEKRLGESFKQVSERLEQVHQGLGDMKNLAAGVGDLKKVLSNVKRRGILGEYHLESLLEQLFSSEQFEKEVRIPAESINRVDFAVKLPGKEDNNDVVYLPIDAKFPMEDFYTLQEAYDSDDKETIEEKRKLLSNRVRSFAKDISEKYIHPPQTTDFAIMFLPSEGVYAEILGKTNLFEQLFREYKIIISGPTTLTAFLNSLQMGFRTLAIQKRSGEVWKLLGSVKREFGKFGETLKKAQRNISGAGRELENLIGTRTRAIEKSLDTIEELPAQEEPELIIEPTEQQEQ